MHNTDNPSSYLDRDSSLLHRCTCIRDPWLRVPVSIETGVARYRPSSSSRPSSVAELCDDVLKCVSSEIDSSPLEAN